MHAPLALACAAFLFLSAFALPYATPAPAPRALPMSPALAVRQCATGNQPYFPAGIPSCVACEPEWSGISSCANAAPAFEDWKSMLFNPISFVDAIKCSCTDTFSSAFPQCLDCFVQTNQCEEYLGVPSLEANTSTILDGIRSICALGSGIFGGVAASQSSAGLNYTYTGVPSQGYPTTTSIGPGGLDYGSAQGASGAAVLTKGAYALAATLVAAGLGVASVI
ncbi:hypothetical protein DMC30DRAFT_442605 [Rhodotorula diobovata]|uniref:Proteophosphoglycan ppg4 n=1 Tax=Rhodotorula diobovata TaxID=5288 RepID=A0A5C5FTG5_9BASI|nr:hypothetical protein DMC30DRAFT_442605 [Rhodotorula diobovata]